MVLIKISYNEVIQHDPCKEFEGISFIEQGKIETNFSISITNDILNFLYEKHGMIIK